MPTVKIREKYETLNGTEKAAIMLLTLGEGRAAPILERFDESEVKLVSRSMAGLGSISADLLEELITRFTEAFAKGGSVVGSVDTAERMLRSFLPTEKVTDIMNYIRGPGGRSTWEKMGMVSDGLLAKYLQAEQPQTIAVVLSKVSPDQASRVLTDLPPEVVPDVLRRMLTMKSVPKEVLRDVEDMLQRDLMLNYASSAETNSFEHMAEIFNRTDSERCDSLLAVLGSKHPEAVMKIKQLMFTFDDLLNIDPKSLQTVIRACDSDTLMYALKGCSPEHRDKIISNLSERAKVIVLDNMETLGPVLMRDVDAAKASILRKAKELAETNTIVIARGQASTMVY